MSSVAHVWFGTSGFSYKEWKPEFYPAAFPAKRFLEFYATQLKSVEIDSTFYRLPKAETLEAWRLATPEDFRFTIKAAQQITHRERLKTPSKALDYLTDVVSALGSRLGLLLFQLPPFLRCDTVKLEAFLEAIPRETRTAFEFRHDSWFNDGVYAALEKRNAALCIHDADEGSSPLRLTADAVYIRLRRTAYSAEQRRDWQKRLRAWADSGTEVFAYIKHKDNPGAPRIAMEFARGI